MLLRSLLPAFLLFTAPGASPDGTGFLKTMHDRYAGKWYRNFTFDQTTEVYRNDTLRRTETWYEAISFPDKFRIDMGVADSGNAVIYKGDSSYRFRKGKLLATRKDESDLTFLLGGMFFYPFDKVLEKIKTFGYDISKSHEDIWKGKPVYVIGANKNEDGVNQLWFDKEKMVLVRQLKFDNKRKEEGLFENHIKLGGGWTETKVFFYVNDKLIQVETYHHCKALPILDARVFEPGDFGKVVWH